MLFLSTVYGVIQSQVRRTKRTTLITTMLLITIMKQKRFL